MKLYFGVAGAAVGLVVSGILVDVIGLRQTLVLMVLFAFACRMIGTAGVWNHVERERRPRPFRCARRCGRRFATPSSSPSCPRSCSSRPDSGSCSGSCPTTPGRCWPTRTHSFLVHAGKGTWVSILTAVAIASMLVAVPFFMRIARERSKREAYSLAMLVAGVSFPLLAFAGFLPGIPRWCKSCW